MTSENTEQQWLVRSHWPNGDITEAVYSQRNAAEQETWFRQRYSNCRVETLKHRSICHSVMVRPAGDQQ